MERPRAGVDGVDEHVEALSRRDHEGVRHVRILEREAVLGDHLEVVPVQVHRVQHRAVVRHVDQHPVAGLGDDRRGGREALPVQHVPERPVTQEQGVLHVDLRRRRVPGDLAGGPVRPDLRVAPPPTLRRDDQGAVQPLAHLLRGVEVRVVDVHPRRVLHREVVDVVAARHDRVLGDVGDAVRLVRHGHPVQVQRRRLRHLVVHDDADPVALPHRDLRSGDLPVERHPVDELPGLGFPLHLGRGELEHLPPVLRRRFERLVAGALRLRREGLHARLVALRHLVGGHRGVRDGLLWCGGPVAAGRTAARAADHQLADHAEILVTGERAVRLVGTRIERVDRQRGRGTGLDLLRLVHLRVRLDGERVRRGPVVPHVERERPAGGRVDHAGRDRELRQRDVDRRAAARGTIARATAGVVRTTAGARRRRQREQQHARAGDAIQSLGHPSSSCRSVDHEPDAGRGRVPGWSSRTAATRASPST